MTFREKAIGMVLIFAACFMAVAQQQQTAAIGITVTSGPIRSGAQFRLSADGKITRDGAEVTTADGIREALTEMVDALRERPLCGGEYSPEMREVIKRTPFAIQWNASR